MSADALLAGLASGDTETAMKRDQDSTDDFEHLEREARPDISESPLHQHRSATQSFLDMERGPEPTLTDKLPDHIADKFTDSESDADTAGESPLHRPAPVAPMPEPSLPPPSAVAHDFTPALTPAPALTPVPTAPLISNPVENLEKSEYIPAFVNEPVHLEPKPVESKPVEPKPVDSKPVEPKPIEPKPVEPKPMEPKPVEPKPVEPKPVESKLAEPEPVQPARAPVAHVIEAEVIFCQMGLDTWFDPQRLHPKVESLIYWRSPARSGAALGAGLALLVALACCSVVSVLSYASLLALSAAVAFRIYKNVLQAIQKTNDGHPFKWLLEKDIRVPAERAHSVATAATVHINALLHELRSLFLVEDLVDSLKFGVMLWCGTYVGACFNGITLIILGWIALFTLPKAYEMNKEQVDANLELARSKINEISAKVRAAVPLGRKADADKDK